MGLIPGVDGVGDENRAGLATCPCGSAWFVGLRAFQMNQAGQITGYSGEVACLDCDQRWTHPRCRLSAVATVLPTETGGR
jgi:hypothetical protein